MKILLFLQENERLAPYLLLDDPTKTPATPTALETHTTTITTTSKEEARKQRTYKKQFHSLGELTDFVQLPVVKETLLAHLQICKQE